MKTLILLFFTFIYAGFAYSQPIPKADSLGLPGDNLNLYAVLDLFQQSPTFESFEKKLNEEGSKINNLDLNNDGKTDYIKVIDHKEGDTHSIVLQDPISETENQDVAVIEIEKDKNNKIKVQIVGNEDLYGKDYIIEPQENDTTQKPVGTINPAATQNKNVVVNNITNNYNENTSNSNGGAYMSVNYWPMMGYMYGPSYSVYSSPWYWNNYPIWWQPWTPWYWHNYYWHHQNYYNHYHNYYQRTVVYRNGNTHNYYESRRTSSPLVYKNRSQGVYLGTYHSLENNSPSKMKATDVNPVYKQQPSNNGNYGRNSGSMINSSAHSKQENNTTPTNHYNQQEQNFKQPSNNQMHNNSNQLRWQNNNQQRRGGGGGMGNRRR